MSANAKLILFIHGIFGDEKSFGDFPKFLKEDENITSKYDVHEFSYDTKSIIMKEGIEKVSKDLEQALLLHAELYHEIIILAHSMGGLVARSYLANCATLKRPHKIVGLLTFATPNLGSGVANLAKVLHNGLNLASHGLIEQQQLIDLQFGSDYSLKMLDAWEAHDIRETLFIQAVYAENDGVVNEVSATHPFLYSKNARPYILKGKDHRSLIKPTSEDDDAVKIAKRFVLNIVKPWEKDKNQPFLDSSHNEETGKFYFKTRFTEFIEREDEMINLNTFANNSSSFFWKLIAGDGGAGKSRLALELALALNNERWYCGFYKLENDESFWRGWQPKTNTLLICDYAGRDAKQIRVIIETLAVRKDLRYKVRLLLIERRITDVRLDDLSFAEKQDERFSKTRDNNLTLKPFTSQQLYLLFCDFLKKTDTHLPSYAESSGIMKQLGEAKLPLYTLFFAAAKSEGHNIRTWSKKTVTNHTLARWRKHLREEWKIDIEEEYAFCFATLTRGLPIDKINKSFCPMFPDFRRRPTRDLSSHFDIFEAMAEKKALINLPPFEPDILGEHFVLTLIEEEKPRFGEELYAFLNLASTQNSQAVKDFVTRVILDFWGEDESKPNSIEIALIRLNIFERWMFLSHLRENIPTDENESVNPLYLETILHVMQKFFAAPFFAIEFTSALLWAEAATNLMVKLRDHDIGKAQKLLDDINQLYINTNDQAIRVSWAKAATNLMVKLGETKIDDTFKLLEQIEKVLEEVQTKEVLSVWADAVFNLHIDAEDQDRDDILGQLYAQFASIDFPPSQKQNVVAFWEKAQQMKKRKT